jgi:hypothetical protein
MNRLRRRWWQLRDEEEGISLVEVLLATFVLAVAVMALGSVGVSSLIQLRMARDREQATNASSAAIERVRAFDFGDIAHDPDLVAADFDDLPGEIVVDGGAGPDICVDGEPLVADSSVSEYVPHRQTSGNQDVIDLFTIVTYADAECGETSNLKRVVSLARFQDGSRIEWVRQESLVAEVGRGLPVPNFRVRPERASLRFNPTHTQAGDERCIDHQLRNLGASDHYEWEVLEIGGEPSADKITSTGWKSANGRWQITAYLREPESASGGTPPDEKYMMDIDTGTNRLASPDQVDTGDSATFTVCYEPQESIEVAELDVRLKIHSRFDDRKFAALRHTVVVGDPEDAYHLLDRDDSTAHPRPRVDGNIRPSLMDPDVTVGGSDESLARIGEADYSNPAESDWSTEVGGDASGTTPGVELLRDANAPADERRADWRYQVSPAMTLRRSPTPTLVIWTAPTSVLNGASVPEGGIPMRLDVKLDGLRSNEAATPFWEGITETYEYTHESTSWVRHEIPLPLSEDQHFQNNRRLRLQVLCHEDSEENCNLAYDNAQYPSRLQVDITP